MSKLQDLKNKVYVEPSTKATRPYLVELIKLQISDAKALSEKQLLGSEGADIATDVCGAIAWNDADEGVEHDSWLSAENEPILYKILNVSGVLDENSNNKEKWLELFSLVDTLQ